MCPGCLATLAVIAAGSTSRGTRDEEVSWAQRENSYVHIVHIQLGGLNP